MEGGEHWGAQDLAFKDVHTDNRHAVSCAQAEKASFVALQLVSCILFLVVLVGCGVQAGSKVDEADCAAIEAFLLIKQDADALDREMLNLRPATITIESVKALVPRYRAAADEYDALLRRASGELERFRSAESEFTPVWELVTNSLTIRRNGFRFYAEAFANPESFKEPSVVEESRSWERRTIEINARVEAASTEFLRQRDFEERDGGQFVVDC